MSATDETNIPAQTDAQTSDDIAILAENNDESLDQITITTSETLDNASTEPNTETDLDNSIEEATLGDGVTDTVVAHDTITASEDDVNTGARGEQAGLVDTESTSIEESNGEHAANQETTQSSQEDDSVARESATEQDESVLHEPDPQPSNHLLPTVSLIRGQGTKLTSIGCPNTKRNPY